MSDSLWIGIITAIIIGLLTALGQIVGQVVGILIGARIGRGAPSVQAITASPTEHAGQEANDMPALTGSGQEILEAISNLFALYKKTLTYTTSKSHADAFKHLFVGMAGSLGVGFTAVSFSNLNRESEGGLFSFIFIFGTVVSVVLAFFIRLSRVKKAWEAYRREADRVEILVSQTIRNQNFSDQEARIVFEYADKFMNAPTALGLLKAVAREALFPRLEALEEDPSGQDKH